MSNKMNTLTSVELQQILLQEVYSNLSEVDKTLLVQSRIATKEQEILINKIKMIVLETELKLLQKGNIFTDTDNTEFERLRNLVLTALLN